MFNDEKNKPYINRFKYQHMQSLYKSHFMKIYSPFLQILMYNP